MNERILIPLVRLLSDLSTSVQVCRIVFNLLDPTSPFLPNTLEFLQNLITIFNKTFPHNFVPI